MNTSAHVLKRDPIPVFEPKPKAKVPYFQIAQKTIFQLSKLPKGCIITYLAAISLSAAMAGTRNGQPGELETSTRKLIKRARLPRQTVLDSLKILHEKKWLRIIHRPVNRHGKMVMLFPGHLQGHVAKPYAMLPCSLPDHLSRSGLVAWLILYLSSQSDASLANGNAGYITKPMADIAFMCGISKRALRRGLNELHQSGLILTIEKPRGGTSGQSFLFVSNLRWKANHFIDGRISTILPQTLGYDLTGPSKRDPANALPGQFSYTNPASFRAVESPDFADNPANVQGKADNAVYCHAVKNSIKIESLRGKEMKPTGKRRADKERKAQASKSTRVIRQATAAKQARDYSGTITNRLWRHESLLRSFTKGNSDREGRAYLVRNAMKGFRTSKKLISRLIDISWSNDADPNKRREFLYEQVSAAISGERLERMTG